ncbi:MAG: secondary thiamine-phosphate synthase enzyme YjbQ [Saprospiraceae bacterium]|nr:secondary thiamine-phosphate synthase enzyme YjbQ [Saprospiraceae bacterium]
MEIITHELRLDTSGFTEIHNITPHVEELLSSNGLKDGQVTVFAVGSTGGVTTLEYEPGLVQTDVKEMLDNIAPYGKDYLHNQTWGDDNGAAHLRSYLVGTSYVCPFVNGKLLLGTWQQIVFVDFDTRERDRRVVLQFIGMSSKPG